MEQQREPLLGPAAGAYQTFPWLIKLLDVGDWLSVQVHPDAAAVRRLKLADGPKTEAWLVLDADPGSRVWAGLRPGVEEKAFRGALARGAVAECLHSFEPQPGDCLFLPAGTVHAVGGGVLFAEVQQTSDATFRLFDWNRRDAAGKLRPLHVEQALASIHWDQGPITPRRVDSMAGGTAGRQSLVHSPSFHLDYIEVGEPLPCGGHECLQALMVLRGRGWLKLAGQDELLMPGQTWVFPALMATADLVPEPHLGCLLCTLP